MYGREGKGRTRACDNVRCPGGPNESGSMFGGRWKLFLPEMCPFVLKGPLDYKIVEGSAFASGRALS
jgi:hypothetical protein